jgi:hypothetical protein
MSVYRYCGAAGVLFLALGAGSVSAFRLRRPPSIAGFTLVAVVTLALGIGLANVADLLK